MPFLLANWKLVAGAGAVIGFLLFLWFIDHRAYSRCEADMKAKSDASLIVAQDNGIQALNVEMMLAQARNDKKASISNNIGKSKDETITPAVISDTIARLYGAP